jgi:hypothetical protein
MEEVLLDISYTWDDVSQLTEEEVMGEKSKLREVNDGFERR